MPAQTVLFQSSTMTPHNGTLPRSNGSRIMSPEDSNKSNSRLLQLAERSKDTRKVGHSPTHHLLSFRNAFSPNRSQSVSQESSNNSNRTPTSVSGGGFARRNSSAISSSSGSYGSPEFHNHGSRVPIRQKQNPKLYTSFSAKSASKLTRAFIKSDPLKTNIEHLVSARPPGVTPNSNGIEDHHSNNGVDNNGRGLSNFITPLKALHASFHDRTKLSNAFAPRSRLFSQREKSGSNTHLLRSPEESINGSVMDILSEQSNPSGPITVTNENEIDFDHDHRARTRSSILHSSHAILQYGNGNQANRKTATPDILEDCLGVDQESGYIIIDRDRRIPNNSANEDIRNQSRNTHNNNFKACGQSSTLMSNSNANSHSHPKNLNPNLNPIDAVYGEQIRDEELPEEVLNENENDFRMRMSTATPMKISSSSCRAQIITLTARTPNSNSNSHHSSQDLSLNDNANSSSFNDKAAGALFNTATTHLSREGIPHDKNIYIQMKPQKNHDFDLESSSSGCSSAGSGSPTWINSNSKTSAHHLPYGMCGFNDTNQLVDDIPPKIPPKRSSSSGFLGRIKFDTTMNSSRSCGVNGFENNLIATTRGRATQINNTLLTSHSHSLRGTGCSSLSLYPNYMHKVLSAKTSDETNLRTLNVDNVQTKDAQDNCNDTFYHPPSIMSMKELERKGLSTGGLNPKGKIPHRGAHLIFNGRRKQISQSFRLDDRNAGKMINDGYGCGMILSNGKKFNRVRSRSLPKSFVFGKTKTETGGTIGTLLSIGGHKKKDDQLLSMNEVKHSTAIQIQGDKQERELDPVAKMRWQKSAASASSSSTGTEKRPKSFDYSQRKAWMKFYRDMEVNTTTPSTTNPNANKSKAISKGSISHLHLLESKDDLSSVPNPDGGVSRKNQDHHAHLAMTPSLFQRFSKTFSLRFGSSSSVNKLHTTTSSNNGRKAKDAVGSSPDLHNRLDEDAITSSGKMRKGKSKLIRGEKCQSGDSGIGIEESNHHHPNRLRRIRSELIEPPSSPSHLDDNNSSSSHHSSGGSSSGSSSALTKMSLVEIPNHVWEEEKKCLSQHQKRQLSVGGPCTTNSYEDILESKLDTEDDGFLSNEEPEDIRDETKNNNTSHYHHYHSLPHKNSRKNKLLLDQHPCAKNLSPSGRSKSLEDEESNGNSSSSVVPEDNSIRGKVIREIVFTEQNYVKTLNDIVQGFLHPCRKTKDLFSEEVIRNIFSNIENILRLHARFLEAMKERIHPTRISDSKLGGIFTEWADHFDMYKEYCCNNPISMVTVRSLMQTHQYSEFFEACRRLQLMDKLPLHGFLLRPIQRICQYHLQLNELLKQTEESHEDYASVVEAVNTMKSVAMKINDTQRQFDSLQEIIRLQNSIEGWEGYDLLSRNSCIMVKGDLIKTAAGKRNKEVSTFLLNKDLVFCKKDFIRKGGLVFDGRIDLEVGPWLNIDSNEEDEFFGMVHNSWRIFSPELRTWILFSAPSPSEKRKWITALEKAVEVRPVDYKMREMAKLITVLSDERPQSQAYSSNSNTLPKSSRKKGKHGSTTNNGKIDADAMLIEVSKLKRPNYLSQQSSSLVNKEKSSKFYV